MAQGRDWRKTLHPASFKGVPFQTERDEEKGGRRIVTHEFPMRDIPFNEDLGETKREFSVTAYVASDNADGEADALIAVCAQRGAGVLVLPMQGPIAVRLLNFERSREKDRAGKVAFTLHFVREGAATALISVASLANMIFVRADAIVTAVANFAEAAVSAFQQPDFVIEAATAAIEDGSAIFEAVRKGEPVDPEVSATQRNAIQALFDAAPAAVSPEDGADGEAVASLVTIARAIGDGMSGEAAIAAFEQVMVQAVVSPRSSYLSNAARLADENKMAVYLAIRLAAATAYAEGIARASINDRPTGITLRANADEYFEGIMLATSAHNADLYRAISDMRGAVVDYLSRAILDLAPVIKVGANRRMPSLWWSHRLYQDPARATQLAERNRVAHPSFMPTDFEALAY